MEEKGDKKQKKKLRKQEKKARIKAFPLWRKVVHYAKIPVIILVILALLAPMAINFAVGFMQDAMVASIKEAVETPLPEEELVDVISQDTDGAEQISALPVSEEGETWAIYYYMCGSNLESNNMNELSGVGQSIADMYSEEYEAWLHEFHNSNLQKFLEELDEQGMDLPSVLYNPERPVEETKEFELPQVSTKSSREMSLAGLASHEITHMNEVTLPENVKVVLQTGGSYRWKSSLVNPNRSQRFLLDSEGFREVEDNHMVDMGDPDTLTDFLEFCEDNYPADHKVLLFFNHGGGSFGLCWDEVFGDDNLTLQEVSESLEAVYGENPSEKPFELVSFFACLMSNLDVTQTFAPYCDYMAAGEEMLCGLTFGDWKSWFIEPFDETSQTNGAMVGKEIVDNYLTQWARVGAKNLIKLNGDMAVTDLSNSQGVYDAYSELMAKVLQDSVKDPSALTKTSRAAAGSVRYAGETAYGYNLIDLGLFMENLKEDYPEEVQKVLDALDDCVLYKRGLYEFRATSGLSVYFPVQIDSIYGIRKYLQYMNTICKDPNTKALYYYKIGGCLNEELTDYLTEQEQEIPQKLDTSALNTLPDAPVTISEDGTFSVNADEEALELAQDCALSLVKVGESESQLIYYGDQSLVEMDEDGTLTAKFDGTWIMLDGHPLATEGIGRIGDIQVYRAPVRINKTKYYMILNVNEETGEVELRGLSDTSKEHATDFAGRSIMELSVGDKVQICYDSNSLAEGDNPNVVTTVYGKKFTYRKDSKFEVASLEDGTYLAVIGVEDVRGDAYSSHVVQVKIKNGKPTDFEVQEELHSTPK